jgi:hypothetical protein
MLSTILKFVSGLIPVSISIPIQAETISVPVSGVGTFALEIPAFTLTLTKSSVA